MPIVKMPDGALVEMPDNPTPEQLQKLASLQGMEHTPGPKLVDVAGMVKESGKSILRGAGQGGIAMMRSAPPFMGVSSEGNNPLSRYVSGKAEKALNSALPPEPGLFHRGMEGVGGAVIGGPTGGVRGAVTNAASGFTGNVAAGAAENALEGQNPIVKKIVSTLVGMGVGGATGAGLAPKQTPAQTALREASEGANFPEAQRNLETLKGAGAKTATLAEAFPDQAKLIALAMEARNAKGGELLKFRTQGREKELAGMSNEFLDRVGPSLVNPSTVANRVANAANDTLGNLDKLRTTGLTNRLAGHEVQSREVAGIYKDLLQKAQGADSPAVGDAYRAVAEQLVKQDGNNFITNLQELSFQLKRLKENPPGPNASTGRVVNSKDLSIALKDAEERLGAVSKPFKEGMEDYRTFSQEVVNPAREGPMGKLADKNPSLIAPTPASRLSAITADQNPTAIGRTVQALGDAKLLGQNAVNKKDIARALLEKQLAQGSTNPGQVVRGIPGSQADVNLDALLSASGVDVGRAKQPLDAAELLQSFKNVPASGAEKPVGLVGTLAQPMRSLRLAASGSTQEKYMKEIAEVLANPSPESLRKLQEIAMFDPALRKLLSAQGALIPQTQAQGGQ